MVNQKGLKEAYSVKTPEDSIELYKTWSATYDEDFAKKNDYRSPKEIAKYFAQYMNAKDTPVLDVGAGTGLVGECLQKAFKGQIDAIDISPEMLEMAKSKKCYTKLIQADLTKKLNINNCSYGAIVSAGTFTHGHIGPKVLDELVRITKPNGLFVFTVHWRLFLKARFKEKFANLKKNITKPVFHEVMAYGNNHDPKHGADTVIISVFRKR